MNTWLSYSEVRDTLVIDFSGCDSDGDGFNDNGDGDVGNDGTPENSGDALILTGNDTSGDGQPDTRSFTRKIRIE